MRNPVIIIFAFILLSNIVMAASPVITDIASITAQDPTPGSTTTVAVWFVANDDDGDLNNSAAAVYFTKSNEAIRSNTSCSVASINSTANNYSCPVGMLFYDAPGIWNVNASIRDISGNYTENTTTNFTYNTGLHMSMTPAAINFGTNLITGQQNVAATDDPIVITNKGNVDITDVIVVAYDMVGETYNSYVIDAYNFECDIDDVADDTIQLSDSSYTHIDDITLISRGASSTASLFYHVDIPSSDIQVQTYSTAGGSDWEIIVSA
jgi:hypothetical protein